MKADNTKDSEPGNGPESFVYVGKLYSSLVETEGIEPLTLRLRT